MPVILTKDKKPSNEVTIKLERTKQGESGTKQLMQTRRVFWFPRYRITSRCSSRNDYAPPATLGDVAERACRLQERRSLLLSTGPSQTGVLLQTGFTVATEHPPDHRASRLALRSWARPAARRNPTAR